MGRITQEYIDNAVKAGWIMHDCKQVSIPEDFYGVLDSRTGGYYDATGGYVMDRPKDKRILVFEGKPLKLGHIMYLDIGDRLENEDHEWSPEKKINGDGAFYFFTLFYTEDGPKWDMTGAYIFREGEWGIPSEYAFYGFKDGKRYKYMNENVLIESISGDLFAHSILVNSGDGKTYDNENHMVNAMLIALGDTIYKVRDITRISVTEKWFLTKSLLNEETLGGSETFKNLIWCHKNLLYNDGAKQSISIPMKALSEYGCFKALTELIHKKETHILKGGEFKFYGAGRLFDYVKRFTFDAIDLLTIEKMIFVAVVTEDQDEIRKFADKATYNLRNYGEFFFRKFVHDRYLEAKEEKVKKARQRNRPVNVPF